MGLDIVGAGFGRTGTTTIKRALEMLGSGPCYHMFELRKNLHHIEHWEAARSGQAINWSAIFGAYRSTLDWPSCAFWRPIAAAYPEAKILLTVRDPESWHRSFMATIFPAMDRPANPDHPLVKLAQKVVLEDTFRGRADDADYAISCFLDNIAAVKAEVPPERLLTFDVREGWEPLCRFLGRPVPDMPMPHENTSEDYQKYRASQDSKASD